MLKVVLDTNIFISGVIISQNGVPAKILEVWRQGKFLLISSEKILQEIAKAFTYPRIKKFVTSSEIQSLIVAIGRRAVITEGEIKLNVVKEDPADNKILEAAIEGRADFIVTGDWHLLKLGEYQGIKIVTAREFL